MSVRSFVLHIDNDAFSSTVQTIGKKLIDLDGKGIHSGARNIDAMLSDTLKGIGDDILLKTDLVPAELERLLSEHLGRDFKHCTIDWM